MNNKTKFLAINGVIAAVYAVLTIVNPLSYGFLQFRVSTLLLPLAAYVPQVRVGILIGVFLGNLNSSLGIIDVFVGEIIAIIVVFLVSKIRQKFLQSLLYALTSGVFVSLELYYVLRTPVFYNILTVGISGFILYFAGTFLMEKLYNHIKHIL